MSDAEFKVMKARIEQSSEEDASSMLISILRNEGFDVDLLLRVIPILNIYLLLKLGVQDEIQNNRQLLAAVVKREEEILPPVGTSLLEYHVMVNPNPDSVKKLVKAGAKVSKEDHDGANIVSRFFTHHHGNDSWRYLSSVGELWKILMALVSADDFDWKKTPV